MELLREINDEPALEHSGDVHKYLDEFKNQDREHFIVIGVDANHKPCYREIATIGLLDQTMAHAREIFRKAITMNVHSIIIAHNHPSGSQKPSDEDIDVISGLVKSGKLLGIPILDSLIISSSGYYSFADHGLIEWEPREAEDISAAPEHHHEMYAWLHSQLEDWWMTFDEEGKEGKSTLDEFMPKLVGNKKLGPKEWEEVAFHMWQAKHDKYE